MGNMIEKVSPAHPDKIADRIAGAIVDLAYAKNENPKVAVEVLIGHGVCHVIAETSEVFTNEEVDAIVKRIAGDIELDLVVVPQDIHLATNQSEEVRCGDNGIFKGVPLTDNEKIISSIAKCIYERYEYDGKYILTDDKFICCQSNAKNEELERYLKEIFIDRKVIVNPLGEWTGGTDVDTGATNRKLGSDMAQSVTGGGLHGKDLSKADVSVNIYAFLKAQETGKIVEIAREYINSLGGFEKFAEWGLF